MATVVAVAAAASAGETLKEQADRLCHAYIDTPEAFTEVPTRPCTAKETEQAQSYASYCLTHAVDGLAEPQDFASVATGGSCGSTSIVNLSRSTPLRNETVNGYGFGIDVRALDYQGHLLVTGGDDLRLMTADEEIILCEFMYRFEGWQPAEPANNELCEKLSQRDYTESATLIAEQERKVWPKYPYSQPVSRVFSDLDGDGSKEEVLGYSYASGAGCGCDAHPLMLIHEGRLITWPSELPRDVSVPPGLQALGSALLDLTMTCGQERPGTKWSIVQMDGKDFVLADFRPERWERWPTEGAEFYLGSEIPSRELFEFRDNKFARVCEQPPISRKVVAHEAVPKEDRGMLNYAPVTEE